MPKSKLMQLLVKYAEKEGELPQGDIRPQALKAQKDEDFYYDLQMMLRAAINEIEGDASLLKARNFDPEMHKLLVGIWRRLEQLYVNLRPSDPWKIAKETIAYLESRHTKAVIENLDFLATHHVKNTNVDFKPNKFMVNPEVRSLKMLAKIKDFVSDRLQEAAPPQSFQSTVRPPSRTNMQAVSIPQLPAVNITPLPPTAPESPESKKRMEEEAI